MALPKSRGDREYKKFIENLAGEVAVRVVNTDAAGADATVADDAAFGVATTPLTPAGYLADETATDSVNEGDTGAARITLDRRQITAGNILDDAAFGIGTDYISPIGALYDDVATDSVSEGDIGAVRMSADRLLYIKDISVYDSSSGGNKTTETSPLYNHVVGDTATVLTNIAQTTTGYIYIDLDTYRGGSIQFITSGTTPTDTLTITLEGSNQDDGTAQASCSYADVTLDLAGVASWVDVNEDSKSNWIHFLDTNIALKYLRIKYVTSTGGGNDADLTVYPRKNF